MGRIRLIPRLDIKGPNIVKGVHLEGLRVIGDPQSLAKKYYDQGADELLYMDIVASLYGRNNLTEIVKRASEEIFMPMAVGGGIRKIEDINRLLRVGADKIAINTAAIKNPALIGKVAKIIGSANLIVSIEAKSIGEDKWEAYVENGREKTGIDAIDWAKKVEELGAGEILVTSIDREGTKKGFDIELIKQIRSSVKIPIIACGGAGSINHIAECIKSGVDAVCFASILHYNKISLLEIKKELKERRFNIRYNE